MKRAFLAFCGVILWYTALKYMELVQAVALNFLGPIFTILFARIFLNDRVPSQRWIPIVMGFTGAFIAGRPDQALGGWHVESPWIAALPLMSAMCISGSLIAGKKLTLKDSPNTVALYLLLLMTPLSAVMMYPEWVIPQTHHWPYLVGLGLTTAGAHYSLNKALSHADVTFLIPFGLARLFFSGFFGYVMFSEIPKPRVWLGAGIILLALSFMDYRKTKKHES
jgi:drug/metabolite transporter (DMT)-like permease